MFFPSKRTSKPKIFLRKQTHKKTQKIQLKNKIINLKATIFSNPNKIIKSQSPKVPNQSKNTTQPTQKKKNLKPRKNHLKQVEPSKPDLSKSETHTNNKPNQQSPIRPTNQPTLQSETHMNKSNHQSPPLPPINHQTNDPPHRSITKPTEPVTKPTTTITDQIRERKRYSGLERERKREIQRLNKERYKHKQANDLAQPFVEA